MVQTLEQYIAQATDAYKPAQTAIQKQMDSLAGQLETTNQQINKNYAQQQAGLNQQRNMAAETASMQAAGSGGSFGGAANIANRKYYDQSFIPAVTQMRTNQSNDLAQARQANEDRRTGYESQMANLNAQANQQGLSQYYTDLGEEQARAFQAAESLKQREFQAEQDRLAREYQAQQAELARKFEAEQAELNRQAQARAAASASSAQNAYYQTLADTIRAQAQQPSVNKSQVGFLDWVNNYSGWDNNTKNYWANNINQIYNQKGVLGDTMRRALDVKLQSSPQYKEYLNWRNS